MPVVDTTRPDRTMTASSRRKFLQSLPGMLMLASSVASAPLLQSRKTQVMTVTGPVAAEALGNTLIHEHILVDFSGARQIDPNRWDREEVINKALPFLKEAKDAGCNTLADCTPNYLGRDAGLLRRLAELSGLNIITNTGYYGGSDHKFLPDHAFTETPQALADRWISEWRNGIDATDVRPGFIKISVNAGALSAISKKLIRAAALTHLQTGLTIASHTGPAVPALEQIALLKAAGVHAGAFIWVHAQNETELAHYVKAVRAGAWVSLDGLNENNVPDYVRRLSFLKKEKCLAQTLVSHDAGWYEPGKPGGGNFRGYTTLFKKLIPALEQEGFTTFEIEQLVRKNPQQAFTIHVRYDENKG
jgi:phosphotriesterase-related protein